MDDYSETEDGIVKYIPNEKKDEVNILYINVKNIDTYITNIKNDDKVNCIVIYRCGSYLTEYELYKMGFYKTEGYFIWYRDVNCNVEGYNFKQYMKEKCGWDETLVNEVFG